MSTIPANPDHPHPWRSLLQLLLVLILGLASLGQSVPLGIRPALAQTPGDGLIAFIRDGNIWTIHLDGTGEQRLTSSGGYSQPALSPDASRLVAVKPVDGDNQVVLIELASGQESVLVPAEPTPFVLLNTYYRYSMPRWSADGSSVYYISSDGRVQGDRINRVELITLQRTTDIIFFPRGLDVSPRDSTLAYITYSNAPPDIGQGLEMADADGGNERTLLPIVNMTGIDALCWNYDGSRLVYSITDASRQTSLAWLSPDGGGAGVYMGGLSTPPAWLACSPLDQRLVMEMDGSLQLFDPASGETRFLARGSQPSWESEAQVPPPPDTPTPTLPAPPVLVCGEWAIEQPAEDDDRIQTSLITASSGDDCHGGFRLENETATWGFGGYTLELVARSENASYYWAPDLDESPEIMLTPLLDLELHAAPQDIAAQASIHIEGSATPATILVDSAIFLIKTGLALAPAGTECIVQEEQLVSIAIRTASIIAVAVERALQGDFSGAWAELSQVLDTFFEQVAEYFRDAGVDCGVDVLEKYIIKKPLAIAEIILEYLAWIPKVFADYFTYQGQPAEVLLSYRASASLTASFGEDGRLYLGDLMLLDPEAEAPGCFGGGTVEYSPTGEHFLALLPCIEGDNEAFIFDADGGNKRAITGSNDYMNYSRHAWSPDGQWLVYHRTNSFGYAPSDAPEPGLVLLNVNTSVKTLLVGVSTTPAYSYPTLPAWSPDGRWIAYVYVTYQQPSAIRLLNFSDRSIWQLDAFEGGEYGSLTWETGIADDTMLLHFLDRSGDLQRTYEISTDASLPPPGSLVEP